MRVNISYSLELENVPREVGRMMVECVEKIRKIHGELDQAIGREPLAMIEELDEIRLDLADADLRLDDCMKILSGYVQTKAQLPAIEHGSPPPMTSEEETKDE